jgi:hypothetical protein
LSSLTVAPIEGTGTSMMKFSMAVFVAEVWSARGLGQGRARRIQFCPRITRTTRI